MKLDFVVSEFEHVRALLEEISSLESRIQDAKDREDQDERKKLEGKLLAKCLEVVNRAPTLGRWYLGATEIADDTGILEAWREQLLESPQRSWNALHKSLQKWIQETWMSTKTDLTALPSGSYLIQFLFRLRKPYVSKDDTEFYIMDNPVRKDKVFKIPYMAPTGWKGALRAAMVRQLVEEKDDGKFVDKRFRLTILFGDEKGEEGMRITGLAEFLDQVKGEKAAKSYREMVKSYFGVKDDKPIPHHSGRLVFFPTFFTQISLEVINPHDRETGAGRQPIYIESVPIGAEGRFTLLYVPFDRIGREEADPVRGIRSLQDEVASDLTMVAEGIRAMFTEYGFGAKTSSGFGVADILQESLSIQPVKFQEKMQKLLFREEESS